MDFDWKQKYDYLIQSAKEAMRKIQSGDSIFIGTGCGQPQHLVHALVDHGDHIYDAHIIHLLTMGAAGTLTEDQQRFLFIIKTNADRLTMLVISRHSCSCST